MSQFRLLLAVLVLAALAAIVTVLPTQLGIAVNPAVLVSARWLPLGALVLYAWRRGSLTAWIFTAMLVGAALGYDAPQVADALQVLSKIFLKLIKAIIAPLLFSTLVVGIAGHANLGQVGRMGWKSLLYFEIVTTVALFIGLAAINLSEAGVGIPRPAGLGTEVLAVAKPQTWQELVLHIFPENLAKSVSEGVVLQVVVFSVLFGIGLAMVPAPARKPMLSFCESLAEVMFKFTNLVMYLAPLAAGAAIAYAIAHMGLGILTNLVVLLATLYAALAVFVVGVLLPVALLARLPIRRFLQAVSEPVTIAFATASSEAALPRAMLAMERIGVPRKIVAFVLPTGYSFNLDGSTLYLSLAAIFVAQAAGIHLGFGQQLLLVFTLMLTSKGVAGIPRATLVILLGTLATFGLPEWPVLVLLGIDVLMDMARTAVNVTGNCLASAVVARWEGEFQDGFVMPPSELPKQQAA